MHVCIWHYNVKHCLALQCQTLFKKLQKKRPNGGPSHRLENVSSMDMEEIG